MAAWLSLVSCTMDRQTVFREQRQRPSSFVLSACCVGAGRVKTEIVHFLANAFTLHKFSDQQQVLGSELVLTDFDEGEMSVQSVLDFMAQARADNKSPATISLRAREGTTLNLLRLYGEAFTMSPCVYRHHRMSLASSVRTSVGIALPGCTALVCSKENWPSSGSLTSITPGGRLQNTELAGQVDHPVCI